MVQFHDQWKRSINQSIERKTNESEWEQSINQSMTQVYAVSSISTNFQHTHSTNWNHLFTNLISRHGILLYRRRYGSWDSSHRGTRRRATKQRGSSFPTLGLLRTGPFSHAFTVFHSDLSPLLYNRHCSAEWECQEFHGYSAVNMSIRGDPDFIRQPKNPQEKIKRDPSFERPGRNRIERDTSVSRFFPKNSGKKEDVCRLVQ